MYWAIGRYAAVLCVAFILGWQVQGWRLEGQAATLQAAHAQAMLIAETKARKTEQTITAAALDARKVSDAKTKQVRANLERTISQLRNRPERSEVPAVTPVAGVTITSCTGTDLFRQDAEFLSREAARADELEAALQQCEATYNAARKELNKE